MLDRIIYECAICRERRYFYYLRRLVILRKEECGPCRYRRDCPYFKVRPKRGLDPKCLRKARSMR